MTLRPDHDAYRLRARLRRLENACGCEAGAIAGLAALTLYVALVAGKTKVDGTLLAVIAKGAAIYVAAGMVGKFVALHRIRRVRAQIRTRLALFDEHRIA